MSSMVTFSDGKAFEMIAAYSRHQITNSLADLLAKTDREILELHFSSAIVNIGDLQEYYVDPDVKTGVITITDDSNNSYIHKDYVIPMKYGMEYVDDDSNPHIVMVLAQLSETDKALREVSGKRKVYTGTDLEIAVAKKHDELSAECEKAIISGVDVGEAHYSLTIEDQANILAWMAVAQTGKSVPYHCDGDPCRVYSSEEFLAVANAAVAHKTHHTTYCNLLMRQVEAMTDVDDVNAVKYGITHLEGEYAEQYHVIMTSLVGD